MEKPLFNDDLSQWQCQSTYMRTKVDLFSSTTLELHFGGAQFKFQSGHWLS